MRVAVVGAGITGLSVALHLAEGGAEVVVHERTGVGAEAFGCPAGRRPPAVEHARQLRPRPRVDRLLPRRRRDASRRAPSPSLEPCGYVFLAHSAERLEALAADVAPAERARHPVGAPRPRTSSPGCFRGSTSRRDGRLVLRRGRLLRPAAGGRRGIRRGMLGAVASRSSARASPALAGAAGGWSLERSEAPAASRPTPSSSPPGTTHRRCSRPSRVDLPIAKQARYLLL